MRVCPPGLRFSAMSSDGGPRAQRGAVFDESFAHVTLVAPVSQLQDMLDLFILEIVTKSDTSTISRPTALKRLHAMAYVTRGASWVSIAVLFSVVAFVLDLMLRRDLVPGCGVARGTYHVQARTLRSC